MAEFDQGPKPEGFEIDHGCLRPVFPDGAFEDLRTPEAHLANLHRMVTSPELFGSTRIQVCIDYLRTEGVIKDPGGVIELQTVDFSEPLDGTRFNGLYCLTVCPSSYDGSVITSAYLSRKALSIRGKSLILRASEIENLPSTVVVFGKVSDLQSLRIEERKPSYLLSEERIRLGAGQLLGLTLDLFDQHLVYVSKPGTLNRSGLRAIGKTGLFKRSKEEALLEERVGDLDPESLTLLLDSFICPKQLPYLHALDGARFNQAVAENIEQGRRYTLEFMEPAENDKDPFIYSKIELRQRAQDGRVVICNRGPEEFYISIINPLKRP